MHDENWTGHICNDLIDLILFSTMGTLSLQISKIKLYNKIFIYLILHSINFGIAVANGHGIWLGVCMVGVQILAPLTAYTIGSKNQLNFLKN